MLLMKLYHDISNKKTSHKNSLKSNGIIRTILQDGGYQSIQTGISE